MFNIPDYTHNVSLRLSQVLNEIGVNERTVMKRRRSCLMRESLFTVAHQLLHGMEQTTFLFGSQAEFTTTPGLKSDSDLLCAIHMFNVFKDWSESKQGTLNFLMKEDDTVSPGYCYLQAPELDVEGNSQTNELGYEDRTGGILLQNTFLNSFLSCFNFPTVQNGPAQTIKGRHNVRDSDIVYAFPCLSWPEQASHWLDQPSEGEWPTADMKEYCRDNGCFVVPVGRKNSANEELEWRISTSLAERCCMFNLNITQIRCYILMKMIIKTFISTHCPDSITSFMCKTVLLRCISNTRTNIWKENNLLPCLTHCLSILKHCILNEHCPHFMIPENNLMYGRFSPDTNRFLLENIAYVVRSNGKALLEIELDQLGTRIQSSFFGFERNFPKHEAAKSSGNNLRNIADTISSVYTILIKTNFFGDIYLYIKKLSALLSKVLQCYNEYQGQDRIACTIFAKQLCITLGSVLASSSLYNQRGVAGKSLKLMAFGLDSDVAYGKLKLASIFYCAGDIERTELSLKNIEECYDRSVVEPMCRCYGSTKLHRTKSFDMMCYDEDDEYTLLKSITASCVKFVRYEINCCPYELQHEMFRSTQQDLSNRDFEAFWMDFAVVDSLPYLYFLQYKMYSQLSRNEDKEIALCNLVRCIDEEPNFGNRETALNILGQCMEQERRVDAAFKCYLISLKLRERQNAAKIHICRLLCSLINNQMK